MVPYIMDLWIYLFSDNGFWKENPKIQYFTKYLLSLFGFSNIMYKLLVILFVIKLYARISIFDFFVILRIFHLELHDQSSVKVELVIFGLVFMKFRKLRRLYRENKKLNLHKTQIFSLFRSSPFLWPLQLDKSCFEKIDPYNCVINCFKFDVYVVIYYLL